MNILCSNIQRNSGNTTVSNLRATMLDGYFEKIVGIFIHNCCLHICSDSLSMTKPNVMKLCLFHVKRYTSIE